MQHIETDSRRREIAGHGSVEFPLVVNHDHLFDFFERRVCCHWHDEIEISVVTGGRARYLLGEREYVLGPGSGLVINSRVPHSTEPAGNDEPVLLTTVFAPELLYGRPESAVYKRLIFPYMHSPELAVIELDSTGIDTMRRVDAEFSGQAFGFEMRIQALLCGLFAALLSERGDVLESSRPVDEASLERLGVLLDTLHDEFAEPLSLSRLAAKINVSREWCCRFFKKMTGKTISQYLTDYRVTRAVFMLQDGRMSITEIADATGFSSPGRFAAAFKAHMGCTPREYRERVFKRE